MDLGNLNASQVAIPTTLLTIDEACAFLKVKYSRLRTAIFRKEIPYIKIGRLVRFDVVDLRQWVDKQKQAPKTKSSFLDF